MWAEELSDYAVIFNGGCEHLGVVYLTVRDTPIFI